jgi:arylsulfatase A-like enzyme
MRIVDDVVAELRHDAERDGRWERTHLWVVSDHGHSPVTAHDDLARLLRGVGHRTRAHPFLYGGKDAAVMVSGNAMAHIYLDLAGRERPWWGSLAPRWESLAEMLLERPSVDLLLLPRAAGECEVRARGRGTALVTMVGDRYEYRPQSGDPLGLGELPPMDGDEAFAATLASDYPDALVQIAHLAGASRSGELILSAARNWDFREGFEPIPHVSSHGALHREHMLVPLLVSRPASRAPMRTVDVMPSALDALGEPTPAGLDGRSFV